MIMVGVAVVATMLVAGSLLTFVRLSRGPGLPDRVVALDLIAMYVAGAIAVYAIATDQPIFILPAITLALVLFVGTVAFAMYVEKRNREGRDEQ
ncbi:MAG: cation:proton antiporter [Phycisphaerales bacterium]|nr:MAG: cation:proton antiporter [Phycisphaerales bacterium]